MQLLGSFRRSRLLHPETVGLGTPLDYLPWGRAGLDPASRLSLPRPRVKGKVTGS